MRRLGVGDEQIAALSSPEPDPALFTEQELLALELADCITESGHNVSDDLWGRLSRHFSHAEIIELVCSIGLFNYFNRVNDALQTEITR